MATSSPAAIVLARMEDLRVEQEDFYRWLHEHAELSHHGHETAAAVVERLQQAGFRFSDIPKALGVPYTYWCIGGIDGDTYRRAEQAGRIGQDVPVNHSATFAPVLQPTLDTGTEALVVAALGWLTR